MSFDPIDIHFMKNALTLARQGLGRTAPNPSVGCVIVKNGRVIARARTGNGGRPHAEFSVLEQAGSQSKGATAYVTLEPCAHEGETPSCARLLAEAGIERCVISTRDSDLRTAGQGVSLLREAGVQVSESVLEPEGYDLNRGFFLKHSENRPFVTLKTATTMDASIATSTQKSQWITGALARRRTHLIRSQHDAIAVGVNTVLADDPSLTSRIEKANKSIVRIIFDTDLRLTGDEKIFEGRNENPVWIVTASEDEFVHDDVKIVRCNPHDLKSVMHHLSGQGVTRLMVEGGASLMTSFIKTGLYDQVIWFRAGSLIGADGLNAIQNLGVEDIDQKIELVHQDHLAVGPDIMDVYSRKVA
jgi:diaminohydroxyphosphoribosylaminopyrimidine deaminase/5-amino-6-(5-phosphoribosylamino)uracil reductase